MRKRLLLPTLALCTALSACGGSQDAKPIASDTTQSTTIVLPESTTDRDIEASTESIEKSSHNNNEIEVDKGLFDVTINIPAEYIGESSQEDLDKKAEEYGYKAILNDDGSATYTMTKNQHIKIMAEMKDTLDEGLKEMIQSDDYPNFTDIKANDNYTTFTVTTKSSELDMTESFSVLAFYMYGGWYNAFNGTPVENVHVDFVNAESGALITSSDSKDMGK